MAKRKLTLKARIEALENEVANLRGNEGAQRQINHGLLDTIRSLLNAFNDHTANTRAHGNNP